jgi:hypothetical protein
VNLANIQLCFLGSVHQDVNHAIELSSSCAFEVSWVARFGECSGWLGGVACCGPFFILIYSVQEASSAMGARVATTRISHEVFSLLPCRAVQSRGA